MNELKADILQLESKIKSLKDFLRNELTVLQDNEKTLLDTVCFILFCTRFGFLKCLITNFIYYTG